MGRFAQLVIGPAGSGKVGLLEMQLLQAQPPDAGLSLATAACSQPTVTISGNTVRPLAALFTLSTLVSHHQFAWALSVCRPARSTELPYHWSG